MTGELVLVVDCGLTNIRAIAVSPTGEFVAQAIRPNRALLQPSKERGWIVWDLDRIWDNLSRATRDVSVNVGSENIKAVTVTTWGADGAPVRHDGTLTYHPISLLCPRTLKIADEVVKELSAWEIFQITGYQVIPFNTLLKLIWLRKNAPSALKEAYTWLMMPGLIVHRLTGKFHIEPTSASTTMAMDLGRRDWSASLLKLAGLDHSFFPEWSQPGEIIGYLTQKAGYACDLPPGIPVIAGGHDTQFALIGSGAGSQESVLSSGTWEILGVRVNSFSPSRTCFEEGLIIEADAQPGLWNPQMLMMGSAVLEWVRDKFFAGSGNCEYDIMIKEASKIPPGSEGVTLIPSFSRSSGPTRKFGTLGTLLGLTLQTSRGHVFRAALEGLSFQLREALKILTVGTGFKAKGIRVVGGGSKNDLWNQIRADVTRLPITVTAQKEASALGAAMTAFVGIDQYHSLEEAQKAIHFEEHCFEPSVDEKLYEILFNRYAKLPIALRDFYQCES